MKQFEQKNGEMKLKTHARLSILICVIGLCSVLAPAQDFSARVRKAGTDSAYAKLLHANIFNFGGVGFGLAITPEEKAFHALLQSERSADLFKSLVRDANPEGQMYALYGLYLQDPDAFKIEAEKLQRYDLPSRWEKFIFVDKGKVRIGAGCLLLQQNRQVVIASIANGDIDRAFNSTDPRLRY